jgi:hypothetical protein
MSLTATRNTEPLFIVIVRSNMAEELLKSWARGQKNPVLIEANRMKIFDQNTLSVFQISWPHDWDQVTIWDCWNKRHIYHD